MRHLVTAFWCFPALLAAADAQSLRIGAPLPVLAVNSPTFTNFTIDASNKKVSFLFQSSDSAVVSTLLFRYGARTGTPVSHKISVQGVTTTNGTGTPNGTVLAAGMFTPPADTSWDGKVLAVAISADGAGGAQSSLTLARGTVYSMVIEPCPDGTAPCSGAAAPDGSNSSSFTTVLAGTGASFRAFPYAATATGATWTKSAGDNPVFGYRSAGLTYGFPVQSVSNTLISSGAESGVSFNIPGTFWSTFKVAGIRFLGAAPAANKSAKIVLYSGTTVLQSFTWDTDIARAYASTSGLTNYEFYFSDATLTALNAGSTYRIGISPQDSAMNAAIVTLDVAADNDRSAFPGGTLFGFTSRSSCGAPCDSSATAWTDVGTSRPMVELILTDITAPPGGGGEHAFSWIQ